jgi:hypothetical protein
VLEQSILVNTTVWHRMYGIYISLEHGFILERTAQRLNWRTKYLRLALELGVL